MDDVPFRPLLIKGALVLFDPSSVLPSNLIIFQYNPESMTRGFQQQYPSSYDPFTNPELWPSLPPLETFQLAIELDAADQLGSPNPSPLVVAAGLRPVLAALELVMYPKTQVIQQNSAQAQAGKSSVEPVQTSTVLFVWGARVLPVRVTSYSVNEQAFDNQLNPILARVDLGMTTLSDEESKKIPVPFQKLRFVDQAAREGLAQANNISTITQLIPGALQF